MNLLLVGVALAVAVANAAAGAPRRQTTTPDGGVPAGRPTVTAPRTAAPEIDGRLDDPVWRVAERITRFVQRRPVEGAPATERTEVSVAYDSQHLYFGIYAHYSDPTQIRANHVDRDQMRDDDSVSIFLDPFLDQQRAYVFSVNGYGVQSDAIMTGGGGGGRGGGGRGGDGRGGGGGGDRDSSWNALFRSGGRIVPNGWTAEMAIPFKSLRYPAREDGGVHRWGFQIERDIESKGETVVWAPVSRDVMGFLSQMGVLEGLANLSTSRNLELLPTFLAVRAGALDSATGRFRRLDTDPESGLTVKYGLTSNLTVDFTFNPDFSQIESDRPQIAVNQRFPLFFPELRPFFLEGQEAFRVGGPVTLVHTRTIVDPRYGAKLTGKIGKATFGMLFASDEAPGRTDDPADPGFGASASSFVGRARYDLYSESHIGVIATDREFLDGHSRLGGVDGVFSIGRNHRLEFRAVATDHRDYETGSRRSGSLIDVGFRKEGRHVDYSLIHYEIDPDFHTAAGFVRRVNTKRTDGSLSYRWWPEGWIINWGPRLNYARNYDFADVLQDEQIGANFDVQFARNIRLRAGFDREMERFDAIDFWKTRWSIGGEIESVRRVSVGGSVTGGDEVRFIDDAFLGRGTNFEVDVTLRPFSRLRSRIELNTSRLIDPRTGAAVFDVKVLRTLTTYQFTNRLLLRNIAEYDTFDRTLGLNLLLTYRVNAGTAFYLGYDDWYQRGDRIAEHPLATPDLTRTNRAVFTKLQYLFRY